MRYALRNQKKIIASLGGDYHQTLIRSLDAHFKQNGKINVIRNSETKLEFIEIENITPGTAYRFVVLGQKYNVYMLAFYKQIRPIIL